ncbi:membrane protein [Frondihabitans sucicola]|uniref:Membrane protein n=1 Tax=Frondihabitans sucicola TaxID=1268041 RepID=A0ABM8GHY0_9MICO|nr:EamA family transporter [Frondihabitans sucicola]BDZ47990.1 membrane protein [Frondihabitans sucicola]
MTSRDRLLAALVAVIWGLNFPATALALEHFPPFLMVAVRFGLLAIPTVLFVPRPAIPVRWLLAIGTGLGILQFAFLYLGMSAGMESGLASIVLQASAPFTVLIAAAALRERISGRQAIGIGIAAAGLAAIAVHRAQVSAILPVALVLAAALGWALGNVASRKAAAPNALHLTLWMSVVPPIPLFVLSWVFEGPRRIAGSLGTAFTPGALPSLFGLLYVVVVATVVGYGLWNGLLARYPSSTVAPFSMLVPVIGVLASWLAFGQVPDAVELGGGVLVVGGVLFASRRRRALPRSPAEPAGAADRFAESARLAEASSRPRP